jgi:hypothetical protein
MGTLSYSTALRNQRLDQVTSRLGASAKLRIYNGTPPANANTALSGNTQLAELICNATAFAGAASGGVLTANAISNDSSADATGTATFYRLLTAGGTVEVQGDAGATGSGASLELATTSIVSGVVVSVSSLTITAGNP